MWPVPALFGRNTRQGARAEDSERLMAVRAIDCWVNVNMSDLGRPAYLEQVAKNTFKQGEDFFRDGEPIRIRQLENLDHCGGVSIEPHFQQVVLGAEFDLGDVPQEDL